MSDTVLALGITVLLLAALAAWVPLSFMAERLISRNSRRRERGVSPQQKRPAEMPVESFEREVA